MDGFRFPHSIMHDTAQQANNEALEGYINKGARTTSKLPPKPVDGQEIFFQNEAMATQGVVWRLRYRAASTNANKWEFVGGSAMWDTAFAHGFDETEITSAAPAFTTVNIPMGLSIVAPLAGIYAVTTSVTLIPITESDYRLFVVEYNGAALGGNTFGDTSMGAKPPNYVPLHHRGMLTVAAAGRNIWPAWQTSVANAKARAYGLTLSVQPVRVK